MALRHVHAVSRAFDTARRAIRHARGDSRTPRRVLLLTLLPIGDTLFATPAIHALRRSHPHAHITALVYPSNAGILANNPDIDRLILHPTSGDFPGWPAYLRFLWGLNRRHVDLLVQFGPAQWWLTQLIRPHRRRRMPFPFWRWFLPGGPRPWRWRHAVTSYATLLTPAERLLLPPGPVLTLTEDDRLQVASVLGESPGPIIALHPGGEGFRGMKRWPLPRFLVLARALQRRYAARIVVLGGNDEQELARRLVAGVQEAHSLAGRLNLGQTLALLERCMLFVGNDSAPMHMAAALGVPTVGIFGPTNPTNFRPRGPRVRVVRSDLACSPCFNFVGSQPVWGGSRCRVPSCLHALSTQAVLDAVEELLGHRTADDAEQADGAGALAALPPH